MIVYNTYIKYIEKQDEAFLSSLFSFYNIYKNIKIENFFKHPFVSNVLKKNIFKKIIIESKECVDFIEYLIDKNHIYLLDKIIKKIQYKHNNEIIYKDGLIAYKDNLILDLSLQNVLNFLRNQL